MIAPSTPAAAARLVTTSDLGEAAVERVERRARVEPEPAEPQDQHAEPEQRHVVTGDRPRLAVGAVLAAARAEQQQRRERAGRADQVDRRRAGEVLHADVGLQPAAAEDPVRGDRVDQRREDDRVDDVDAELDALERRAPHDRQRDGAEDELEEQLRLDRRVGEAHDREGRLRIAVVAQEEAVRARSGRRSPPKAKAKPTAQYRIAAIEKFVRIFATTVPAFLPREKPISRKAKPACMNITRQPATITQRELMPTESGRPLPAASKVSAMAAAGRTSSATRPKRTHGSFGTSHRSSWVECAPQSVAPPAGASLARCRKIDPAVIRHPVEAPRPRRANGPRRFFDTLDKAHASLPPLGSSCVPTHATQSPQEDRSRPCPAPASRTSPPRSGAPTAAPSARPTSPRPATTSSATNVFSLAVQRQRLPKDVYRQLQATARARRGARPRRSPTPVAQAMKEWAMETRRHALHALVPAADRLDRREARLLLRPARRRHRDRRVLRQGAHPGRAGRVLASRPAASARPSRRAATRPGTRPRRPSSSRTRTARCSASRRRSRRGPARRSTTRSRCCARWTRSRTAAVRALKLLGDEDVQARLHDGRARAGVLPDRRAVLLRAPRPRAPPGRTLFGAKPPKGHELDDHYFGSIPERVLACMLEVEQELAKLGVPIKTRHNEVAPEPVRGRADLRELERRLRPPAADDAGDAERRAPLRARLPAAREAVRGRQRLGQAQQLVDGHRHRREPARAGRHAATRTSRSCSSARRSSRRSTSTRACCARSIATAGQDHRLGANEAPPAIISIFLGAELEKVFERDRGRRGAEPSTPGSFLGLGTPVLPPLPMHGGDRNRTSPFAFTGNKFEFRALGSSMSPACPTRCSTRSSPRRSTSSAAKLARRSSRGATLEAAVVERRARTPTPPTSGSCFDGDNYSEEWHAEAEKRGLLNLRTHAGRATVSWSSEQTIGDVRGATTCSPSASSSRATRSSSSSTSSKRQHRGRDRGVDRPHDAAARGASATSRSSRAAGHRRRSWPRPRSLVERRSSTRSSSSRRPTRTTRRTRASSSRSTCATR